VELSSSVQGKSFLTLDLKTKALSNLAYLYGAEPPSAKGLSLSAKWLSCYTTPSQSSWLSQNRSSARINAKKVTICIFLLCSDGPSGAFPHRI